ncbi:hypothetical protein ACOSP7_007554 [Xanthoceras sorbifolium]
MASSSSSSLRLIFLFSIVFAFIFGSNAFKFPKPNAFIFPIKKDDKTLQFYTSFQMGTPTNYIDLVIDLGGQLSWLNCDEYNSSSYRPVRCWSRKCVALIGGEGASCFDCRQGAPRPGCTKNTCAPSAYNPKTNMVIGIGAAEDTTRVSATDGKVYVFDVDMRRFSFACGVKDLLSGLANGTQGILGLGRAPSSLATQLSSSFKKIQHKFALCPPSSTKLLFGSMFFGGGPYFMPPYPEDATKLLIKTPLIINPVGHSRPPLNAKDFSSQEYFIDVKSIKIDGKPVSFNTSLLSIDSDGMGGTMISTMTYYTVLHADIYNALVRDFVKEAAAKKMKRVGSVAPFGACFSSKSVANTMTGPAVPNIDLVVRGKNAFWRIYGANSMVKVKKNVLCLGFVDGGSTAITSIVIGGHLLEDNLLEFDLASSMLGFSSSLLFHNSTCSQSRIF